MILNLANDIFEFFDPLIEVFKDIWNYIQSFFLQYVSENVFNIFVFGILVAAILIILLAVINNRN